MKVQFLYNQSIKELEKEVNSALDNPPANHFLQEIQFHAKSVAGGSSYIMLLWSEIPNTE